MAPFADIPQMQIERAFLTLGNGSHVEVASEEELEDALNDLASLEVGQVVALHRASKDYIRAARCGDLWSVVARRKGMWTAQSFTAGSTTEYSERRVLESRRPMSLMQRLAWMFRSPPPEKALSGNQVRVLFAEYLLGKKFSIPISGAG